MAVEQEVTVVAIPRIRLRAAPPRTLLGIYLSDHLAAAVGGTQLAERVRRNNQSTDLEPFLRGLAAEIAQDRRDLERILRYLGVAGSRTKQLAAIALERIGRGKLNGQVVGYSPLSRLVELEALSVAVESKLNLWHSLSAALPPTALPAGVDLDRLIRRGEEQRAVLRERRADAAREAFAGAVDAGQ
ncbi:MAG TPA: hypothetical protein VHF25_16880 [Nitriliruptorales bacterium]|nr:hypothetical protein [Nitriliruptorales bacterium]